MPHPAYTRTAILYELRQNGPMSAAEITEALQLSRRSIDACLIGTRKRYGTDVFRIAGYRRQEGRGGREIPLYTPGPGRDAPRPVLGAVARRQTERRYAEKARLVINARNRIRRARARGAEAPAPRMFDQLIRRA